MPLRLIPIAATVVFVLLVVLGALYDENTGRARTDFDWDQRITDVDSVLDDALSQKSFRLVHDTLTGAAEGVEGGVEDVAN